MANYAASVLAEAQVILAERYASPEKRLKADGVLGAFLQGTDVAMQDVKTLRTKEERPINGYFFNRSSRNATNSRTHDHAGSPGDSTEVLLDWTTHADKFTTSLKRSDNNVFNDAQIMANEIDNALKNLYESMDSAALTYLATNKSTVNAATKNGVYDTTNDVFEIATSNIARFIQYANSMMRQNYYKNGSVFILDPVLFLEAQHYLQQGAGNDVNTAYQRAGMRGLFEALTLADANYTDGMGYTVAPNSLASIDWIPTQNRQGWGDYETATGGYGMIVDPRTGFNVAVHGYSQRADTSSKGGDTQDVKTEWELSVDLSLNNSPLTPAGETTIFEVGAVEAPGNV